MASADNNWSPAKHFGKIIPGLEKSIEKLNKQIEILARGLSDLESYGSVVAKNNRNDSRKPLRDLTTELDGIKEQLKNAKNSFKDKEHVWMKQKEIEEAKEAANAAAEAEEKAAKKAAKKAAAAEKAAAEKVERAKKAAAKATLKASAAPSGGSRKRRTRKRR